MDRLDVEGTRSYKPIDIARDDTENDALLPTSPTPLPLSASIIPRRDERWRLVLCFAGGVLACVAAQYATSRFSSDSRGSSIVGLPGFNANNGHFPPANPTNAVPSLFPTDVGYAGPTPTGAEAGIVATAPAYPQHTGAPGLLLPQKIKGSSDASFNLFKSWGNLSPWYTVPSADFGLPDASPNVPDQCRVTGLHVLHRHGARYPTEYSSWGGPTRISEKINKSPNFTATGELEFLNDWAYLLGAEILTPFGRHQLYDLGVSMRMKYGFLLQNFTKTNTLPVFRTESQNRMLQSAINFALGFFGDPVEKQYQQLIMLKNPGINSTISPKLNCPNAYTAEPAKRGQWYIQRWADMYLKDALARIEKSTPGVKWTIEDIYALQTLCPYETTALGYSKFCALFTREEWEGFHYSIDLEFWYDHAFGSPFSLAQGAGWVTEMVARLMHTPVAVHDLSTNATLHNPIQFPLNDALYVDVTHDTVFTA
ncbi:hypothetical protein FS749_002836, partial [Ceratobasidium sp. UAMH 11750]